MASLYIDPDLATAAYPAGATVILRGTEAHHAAVVARVRVGEWLRVGDGAGTVLLGRVASVAKDAVAMVVESSSCEPRAVPELWLAQALAKGDRDELAVQAATELGVSGILPWAAERSVSRWSEEKAAKGVARWRAIVMEASKQSIRSWVPEVRPPVTTAELAALAASFVVILLDPEARDRLTDLPVDGPTRILLVVGPEGGISAGEQARLLESGARSARLGREVLRTSTAGPAALAVLNARLGRW